MIDIACVGILVADVIVKPVDGIPEKGLLKLVDSIELFSGGNAMTASINVKKLPFFILSSTNNDKIIIHNVYKNFFNISPTIVNF